MPTITPKPGQVHNVDASPLFSGPTEATSPITKPGDGGFEPGDALLLEGG